MGKIVRIVIGTLLIAASIAGTLWCYFGPADFTKDTKVLSWELSPNNSTHFTLEKGLTYFISQDAHNLTAQCEVLGTHGQIPLQELPRTYLPADQNLDDHIYQRVYSFVPDESGDFTITCKVSLPVKLANLNVERDDLVQSDRTNMPLCGCFLAFLIGLIFLFYTKKSSSTKGWASAVTLLPSLLGKGLQDPDLQHDDSPSRPPDD